MFKETQHFTQWWLWLLLIAILIIPLYGVYQQIYLDVPFGNNPMPNTGLLLFLFFMILLLVFFRMMRLETTIDKNRIHYKFFPFFNKYVSWEKIASAKIVDYGFVGYGIRYGSKHGVVYNTRGSKGLAIVLKNGTKFCIGTQKPEELEKYIKTNQLLLQTS